MDFTNNAKAILKAFAKYRKGTPFVPEEPDPELCTETACRDSGGGGIHAERRRRYRQAAGRRHGCPGAVLGQRLRVRFQAKLSDPEDRKEFVYLLAPLRQELPFLDVLLHLCAADQAVRHVRRICRPAAHQGGQRVRVDEADSPDGSHQGCRGISGRRDAAADRSSSNRARGRRAPARRRRRCLSRT